jgi:DNA-binding phage protein
MTRRSRDWNEGLAKSLRRPHFARAFIQGSLEEGLSIQEVLAKVIRAYGVKEFSEKVGLPSSNILRAISPAYNPTVQTLNRLLMPFDLTISVTPMKRAGSGARTI